MRTEGVLVRGGAGNHVRRLMGWARIGKDGVDELDYYKSLAMVYESRISELAGRLEVSLPRGRPTNSWPFKDECRRTSVSRNVGR